MLMTDGLKIRLLNQSLLHSDVCVCMHVRVCACPFCTCEHVYISVTAHQT